MDKQNVVYPHSEILFGPKKEWNADVCYNMDETWKYAKWKKLVTRIIYYMITFICKSIRAKVYRDRK